MSNDLEGTHIIPSAEKHMATQRTGRPEKRPLEAVGIGELEEQAYLCLLEHPRATVGEVAQALHLSHRRAQSLLDTIEAKGLATHSPERPRRYIFAAPDIAMEALILERENDLQQARSAVKQLQERAALHRQSSPEPMIELITNRESERQIFNQMQAAAQHEVVFLVRPPLLISRRGAPQERDKEADARSRGVRYRGVVDAEYLAMPGAVEHVRADIKKGDEVRVVPKLPFKMVLADRRTALIPLDLESPSSDVLLVRSSPLLDALDALFEMIWERAAPISITQRHGLAQGDPSPRLPDGSEDLLQLMAAGLNDKAIAYELGLSIRTLNRRIFELTKSLNARTRFQIGWLASPLMTDARPAHRREKAPAQQ